MSENQAQHHSDPSGQAEREGARSSQGSAGVAPSSGMGTTSGRHRLFARLGRVGAEALVGRVGEWDDVDRAIHMRPPRQRS